MIEIPIIKQRVDYLSSALSNAKSQDKEEYAISLILFSILIENVSLFSQFAIILSFTRFKGHMKNVSNIIAWTSIDEQLHANAGIYIINKIKDEASQKLYYPDILIKHPFKESGITTVDKSIGDGGAAETETSLFECFAHHSGFLCFSRNFVN